MVTVVLVFNLLITLLCLYAAWRLWQLRLALAKVTSALTAAERITHRVLCSAPHAVSQRQQSLYSIRQQYQQITVQLLKVQKILALLGLGQSLWQWYGRNLRLGQRKATGLSDSVPETASAIGRSPHSSKRSKTKKPRATYT